MSKWNCRKGELFIPDKDTPKTYACGVCGSKIVPQKANRYTVVDRVTNGGIANAITGTYTEPETYDAFDCPVCGCQMVAKNDLRKFLIVMHFCNKDCPKNKGQGVQND